MTHAPRLHVDHVVIGSSPIPVLDALARAADGASVMLIDDRTQIGGAWDTADFAGYRDIETCAHILRYQPEAYDVLTSMLGLELEPMLPPPRGYSFRGRGRLVSARYETWRWKLNYVRDRVAYAGVPTSWSRLEHDVLRPLARAATMAVREAFGHRAVQQYPVGGTPRLLRRLESMLADSTVTVRLGTRVTEVARTASGVELTLDDGTTISAGHLTTTSMTRLRLAGGAAPQHASTGTRLESTNLVLVASDPSPIGGSFLEFNGHPRLRRVADVSRSSLDDVRANGEKIIAVTFRPGLEASDHLRTDARRDLIELGLLAPDATIRAHRWYRYPINRPDPAGRAALEDALGDRLTVLWTIDLTRALAMYRSRWTALAAPSARRSAAPATAARASRAA